MAYQAQSTSAVAQSSRGGTVQVTTDQNGPYLFRWLTQSTTADFINYPAPTTPPESSGALSGVQSIVGRCYPDTSTVLVEANPSDSNNLWLHITNSSNFPSINWFWNSTPAIWGRSLGKGYAQYDWMYTGSFAAARLTFQLNSKAPAVPAYDDNEGLAVRTKSIGGTSDPGLGTGAASDIDIPFVTAAAGTKYTVVYRWNRMTTNTAGARTRILYVLENGGTVRQSGWASGTSTPRTASWHQAQFGNDTGTALEQWITNCYIGGDWAYDLPVNLWQDFEFATLNQANLEAQDHNPTAVWQLGGTTTRFTTQTAGKKTNPSTINLWTDSGTLGMRNDLNATAAGHYGTTFANVTTGISHGYWYKTANLANGTAIQISFCSEQTVNNNILRVSQQNSGGQQQLFLSNHAGTASSTVNVSADTWYWVAVYAIRNNTCRLQVYDENGTQVGSEVTVTGSNNSIGSIRFGSQASTTSQSAGVYNYVSNVVRDTAATNPFYPLKPWQL
jgi:hypothetical protein